MRDNVKKLRDLLQTRCRTGEGAYSGDDDPRIEHHHPCDGCGKRVHSEYCFDWLLHMVLCDACQRDLYKSFALDIR